MSNSFVTPWTVACQDLSIEFSRQECWSGLPFPSPGEFPHLGIEPGSPASQANCLLSEPLGKPAYWSELSCPPPGTLANPGIKPRSPTLQVNALPPEPPGKPNDVFNKHKWSRNNKYLDFKYYNCTGIKVTWYLKKTVMTGNKKQYNIKWVINWKILHSKCSEYIQHGYNF